MGNQSSRKKLNQQNDETDSKESESIIEREPPKRGILRSPSGADFQDLVSTQLMPINKLAQVFYNAYIFVIIILNELYSCRYWYRNHTKKKAPRVFLE